MLNASPPRGGGRTLLDNYLGCFIIACCLYDYHRYAAGHAVNGAGRFTLRRYPAQQSAVGGVDAHALDAIIGSHHYLAMSGRGHLHVFFRGRYLVNARGAVAFTQRANIVTAMRRTVDGQCHTLGDGGRGVLQSVIERRLFQGAYPLEGQCCLGIFRGEQAQRYLLQVFYLVDVRGHVACYGVGILSSAARLHSP